MVGKTGQRRAYTKALKCIPWVLALTHLSVVIVVFGGAIAAPERRGLLPIYVIRIDYPISYAVAVLSAPLWDRPFFTWTTMYIANGVLYAVVGSAWWYAIGILARRILRLVATKRRSAGEDVADQS
jgi:hypothetical protein